MLPFLFHAPAMGQFTVHAKDVDTANAAAVALDPSAVFLGITF